MYYTACQRWGCQWHGDAFPTDRTRAQMRASPQKNQYLGWKQKRYSSLCCQIWATSDGQAHCILGRRCQYQRRRWIDSVAFCCQVYNLSFANLSSWYRVFLKKEISTIAQWAKTGKKSILAGQCTVCLKG